MGAQESKIPSQHPGYETNTNKPDEEMVNFTSEGKYDKDILTSEEKHSQDDVNSLTHKFINLSGIYFAEWNSYQEIEERYPELEEKLSDLLDSGEVDLDSVWDDGITILENLLQTPLFPEYLKIKMLLLKDDIRDLAFRYPIETILLIPDINRKYKGKGMYDVEQTLLHYFIQVEYKFPEREFYDDGHAYVVTRLLLHLRGDIDFEIRDSGNMTALFFLSNIIGGADYKGRGAEYCDIALDLMERGANVNALVGTDHGEGYNILENIGFNSKSKSSVKMALYLLDHGSTFSMRTPGLFINKPSLPVLKRLLEDGADPNGKPIMYLLENAVSPHNDEKLSPETIELLLSYGADVSNVPDILHRITSPAMPEPLTGETKEVFEILINAGARMTGRIAYELASYRDVNSLEFMGKKGFDFTKDFIYEDYEIDPASRKYIRVGRVYNLLAGVIDMAENDDDELLNNCLEVILYYGNLIGGDIWEDTITDAYNSSKNANIIKILNTYMLGG